MKEGRKAKEEKRNGKKRKRRKKRIRRKGEKRKGRIRKKIEIGIDPGVYPRLPADV